ncbi:MAG: response regulator transcription factor [Syntrophomonadaceae bacterium]|nr:response regulator transcription factor [Syntrophomonadaceae bacterium]
MRLVLIDDHPLVLKGIIAVIQGQKDMEVVGTASCGEVGIIVIQECQPDIALVDLRLPGEYGLDIIKKARKIAPQCRFIVLTSYSEKADIKRAMAEKVEGYVLKEAMPEEILNAIRLVARNRTYIDPIIMQTLLSQDKDDPTEQLTPRELEVLEFLARGMSNRDIAATLFVTEYTIKKHVGHILEKLGLTDRTQAALYAFSKGLGQSGSNCLGSLV